MDHTPLRPPLVCGRRAALALAALLAATPALAAPVTTTLRFTGLDGFGVSEPDATGSGLPVLSLDLVRATGLEVERDLDEGSLVPGPPATETSSWTVTNRTGHDLLGDLYLVFGTPLPHTIDLGGGVSETVDYDPSTVGLTLRNDAGGADWVLLQSFDEDLGNLYYPAVSLDSLMADATSEVFEVHYVLDVPQTFVNANYEEVVGIPGWRLFAAFVPIPEPSTALLVAGGLAALATGRRRRS